MLLNQQFANEPHPLLCCMEESGLTTSATSGSSAVTLEAWIVLGIVTFGAIIVLSFTWVMFFYSLHRTDRQYREVMKSLKRRRMNRARRQAEPSSHARRVTPPMAISYRPTRNSSAEVYVSLAQMAALNRYLWRQNVRQPPGPTHIEMDVFSPDDCTPSAPPYPGSPPDYYEYTRSSEQATASQDLRKEETERENSNSSQSSSEGIR